MQALKSGTENLMRYKIAKTDIIDPKISSPEWESAELGELGFNPWGEYDKAPKTTFKLLAGPEGLSVLMHTDEKHLRAECLEQNGEVCEDSCMEFFWKPDVLDPNYLNFEINPKGVLHLGIGDGRHGRVRIFEDSRIFSIESKANDGDWTLKYYIPYSFIYKHFSAVSPVSKANFYKCGDLTLSVHYGVWSKVEVPAPDYHVPDFFGFLELD